MVGSLRMIPELIQEDIANEEAYVSKEQAEQIEKKIAEIVAYKCAKSRSNPKNKAKIPIKVVNEFYEVMGIRYLGELPQSDVQIALAWLDKIIQSFPVKIKMPRKPRPKRIIDPEVLELSKALQKKAQRELKMNISKVLYFAYQYFKLPNMISKLEWLSKADLEDLWLILFKGKRSPVESTDLLS
jgi:hypothetical protein